MLGQNDASLRPDLPAFERFDTCEHRPGRKTLDQQAKSGDPEETACHLGNVGFVE